MNSNIQRDVYPQQNMFIFIHKFRELFVGYHVHITKQFLAIPLDIGKTLNTGKI